MPPYLIRRQSISHNLIIFLIFFIILFACANLTLASDNIIISEIAWMGTDVSANDEWFELHNPTSQAIDITGWILKARDDTPNITLTGSISAQGYFLLERTDDDTVPNIAADQIYTGALSNTGEILELRDSQNNLIDTVDASAGWPSGDNATKQTMERKSDGTWQTSLNPLGTAKAQNSSGATAPPSQTPTSTPSTIEQPTSGGSTTKANQPPKAYAGLDITALINQEIIFSASQSSDPDNDALAYFWNFGDGATDIKETVSHIYPYAGKYLVTLVVSDGKFYTSDVISVNILNPSVIISEFMPNPIGSDDFEWIELYNQSDKIANLSGWQLDDEEKGCKPFIFPDQSLISPYQYLVIQNAVSKITLNNNADQVRLLYPDGSLASEISYATSSQQGLSVAYDGQDYFWTKIPTPGLANIISAIELDQTKNYSANNPAPVIQSANDLPASTSQSSLQSDFFSAQQSQKPSQAQDQTSVQVNKLAQASSSNLSEQSIFLAQTASRTSRANLILIFSIIISASLFLSWLLVLWRKKSLSSKI